MAGSEINCVLLIIPPGYEHRPDYANNPRNLQDPMRVLTGERYFLPVAVGRIEVSEKNRKKGIQGGPALIGLSFGPPRSEKKSPMGGFEAIHRLVTFARAPYDAERDKQIYWRTLRADAMDATKIRGLVVVVVRDAAEILARWIQEHVTRGFPSNFIPTDDLLPYLFSDNPGELLKRIGINISQGDEDAPPEEGGLESGEGLEDDGWGEDDEDELDDIWEEESEEVEEGLEPEEAEEIEESLPSERTDRPSSPPSQPPSRFPSPGEPPPSDSTSPGGVPPSPAPSRDVPPGKTGESTVSEEVARLLQAMKSSFRQSSHYPRPKEEKPEPGEFDFIKPYLPTPEAALVSIIIALLSLFIRPAAILTVVLYGGRSGLRILLGAFLLSLPYIAIVLHLPAAYYVYVPIALAVLAGFMMMNLGVRALYEKYKLKFELSSVSKRALGKIKSMAKKTPVVAAGGGGANAEAMGATTVSMQEATGSLTDLTLLLSLLLFAIPPVYPAAAALFVASVNAERKKPVISFFNLLGMVAFAALVLGMDKMPPGWIIASLVAFSLSYISPNSPHDINRERIKNAPKVVRDWLSLFVKEPKQALLVLWSGKAKPKEEQVEFVLPPLPPPVRRVISEDLVRNISGSGLLARQHVEALEKAVIGRPNLYPVPISFELVPKRTFYRLSLRPTIVQPRTGLPIASEAASEMLRMTMSRAITAGFTMGEGNILEAPAMCPILPTIPPSGCQLVPMHEEVVVNKDEVVVPVGRSFMYYLDESGEHVHYTSGILLSPRYAGHLTIGAASGSGKSVMVRAVVNGIADASRKYPIRVLYIEGKQESSSPERHGDYLLCPITWVHTGPQVISMLAAILAMLDYRQMVLVALSKLHKTAMEAQSFAQRYGAFPLLVVILDEFWVMSDEAKTVKTITISGQEQGDRKIPAGQFFVMAVNRFLTTARSLGGTMILTTQRTTREAITSSIKANSTFVIGAGVPQQLISMCFEQSATQWLARLNKAMPQGQSLPPRWCFVHGGGPGGRAAFIRPNGTYTFSSDSREFPDEPPVIDVMLPRYTDSFKRVSEEEIAKFDQQALLADIDEAVKRGLFVSEGDDVGTPPIPPSVGWLTAMGMAPFPSLQAFYDFGKINLTNQAAKLETRISTDESGEEE